MPLSSPPANNVVVSLSEYKDEKEWQRIMPILKAMEEEFNAQPKSAAELAEEDAIEHQLRAIECCTRAKVLLLRTLNDPARRALSWHETRLKKLLENDKSVAAALCAVP